MGTSLAAMFLGIVLGARHALEPDHLAAVTVLASESPNPRRGAILGLCWGVGHTTSLLVVGMILAVLSTSMPPRWADAFEFTVAIMLVLLGTRAVVRAFRDGTAGPATAHHHGDTRHVHAGPDAHVHLGPWTMATRPLMVGLVHGLAGSGALTAMIVAELPALPARLAFVLLFGLGSILGMTALSGLAGWQLAKLSRAPRVSRVVFGVTGMGSVILGCLWGWPLLGHLFS